MSDNVQKFELSEEMLLDSAERRFQDGDFIGALTMLNKRNKRFPPGADAQALLADIYEAMELWQLAADAWFRFLDVCNEADFGEGYEGLAVAFMNMGNDVQSALYYHRSFAEEGQLSPDMVAELGNMIREARPPKFRLVRDAGAPAPEILSEGLSQLKAGELEKARETLLSIDEDSSDYPSAAGLAAMCTLMLGDEEEAEKACEELLKTHPENVQALTTSCAVFGARGKTEEAKEVAKKLAALPTDATDDLYRIATALCETGLDEEAYRTLSKLRDRIPYDEVMLYFLAVAAYRIGKTDEAIDALEVLTTVYPRKAVAAYYLQRLRAVRDGDEKPFSMNYFYRMPEEEYSTVANFLLSASTMDEHDARQITQLSQLGEFFRLAFDEMEGRDEKLKLLAVRVADRTRSDEFLRDVLLDCEGDEYVKIAILHTLAMRNEEDSFGVVLCNIYKEYVTHALEIGEKKREPFMKAFADVYAKFAVFSEENAGKICAAAEDLYLTLEECDALSYCDERAEIAAAIYREARLEGGERKFDEIVKMFEANKYVTETILNFMM